MDVDDDSLLLGYNAVCKDSQIPTIQGNVVSLF
jgi:hypothetical protein